MKKLTATIPELELLENMDNQQKDIIPANPEVRNFTYTFMDGKLYFRENSQMYRKEVSANMEERIKAMDNIRAVTRELIEIQTQGCSEQELAEKQKVLNERYDVFAKKYGSIAERENSRAFRNDADYPLLCSLEVVDEDGIQWNGLLRINQWISILWQLLRHMVLAAWMLILFLNRP